MKSAGDFFTWADNSPREHEVEPQEKIPLKFFDPDPETKKE